MRLREWLVSSGPRLLSLGFMIALVAHIAASPWTS